MTAGEVIHAIRKARTRAAPGIDGIPIWVLQHCIHTLLPWLLRIYSGSLLGGATIHLHGAPHVRHCPM